MRYGRYFPIFSVAFILVYAVSVYFNLAMFTYLPAAKKFYWFVPAAAHAVGAFPMFWYGWLVTTSLAALAITAINASVPTLKDRAVWPALVWASPIFAVVVVVYALRIWFTL